MLNGVPLLLMPVLAAMPTLAGTLPSADYEVAALDCPLSVPNRPDLVLAAGNARRRDDTDWAAGPPNDLKTKFSGGQHFGRLVITGRFGHRHPLRLLLEGLRWVVQLSGALLLALLSWPFGRHRAVPWLIKAWANGGKLTAFFGARYGEYA